MRSKSTLSLFMVESGRAGTACACPSCLLCYLNVARNRGVLSLIVFCWALPRLKIGCLCRTENGLASRAKRYPLCCLPTCEPCWLHTWQARWLGATLRLLGKFIPKPFERFLQNRLRSCGAFLACGASETRRVM